MKLLAGILFLFSLLIASIWGFGASMTFLWPGYLLLGLASLLTGVVWWKNPGSRNPRIAGLCLASGLLLFSYLLIRGFQSPVPYLAREDLALAAAWFAVWAISALAFSRSRHRIWIARTVIAIAVVNLGFVIWQSLVNPGAWVLPGYSRTYLDRVGGVFNNPNHLAAFLAAVSPLFLALAVWGRAGIHRRLLLVFLAVMCLLAIGLTQSRGGLLAAGTGLFAVTAIGLWLHRSVWRKRTGLAVTAVAFALVAAVSLAVLNLDVLKSRFASGAFTVAKESNRPLIWKAALEQHAESPFFGTGSRTHYYFSRKFRSPDMHVSMAEPEFAHNDYLQFLAEYGWAGAALLLLFCAAHGRSGLRFLRRISKEHADGVRTSLQSRRLALTAGSLAGLSALGMHAAVDFPLHIPAIALLSAVLLGFLANPGHFHHEKRTLKTGERFSGHLDWLVKAAVPALGAVLLFFGSRYVRSEWHVEEAERRFAGGLSDLTIFAHLQRARTLDPANPFAHSLSGHAHLYAIDHSMPETVRIAYLEKALTHFERASTTYPQDIYSLLGLASCLDALERNEEAEAVLARARSWAPLYGNIMHAQGVHFQRIGELERAELHFKEARDAGAFRDWRSALRALEEIAAARNHRLPPHPETVAGE